MSVSTLSRIESGRRRPTLAVRRCEPRGAR
ncbi:hypothetical protein [Streptomyces violaceusniger]|nr:hypothetical protein [Streptomyces violaceusniger]